METWINHMHHHPMARPGRRRGVRTRRARGLTHPRPPAPRPRAEAGTAQREGSPPVAARGERARDRGALCRAARQTYRRDPCALLPSVNGQQSSFGKNPPRAGACRAVPTRRPDVPPRSLRGAFVRPRACAATQRGGPLGKVPGRWAESAAPWTGVPRAPSGARARAPAAAGARTRRRQRNQPCDQWGGNPPTERGLLSLLTSVPSERNARARPAPCTGTNPVHASVREPPSPKQPARQPVTGSWRVRKNKLSPYRPDRMGDRPPGDRTVLHAPLRRHADEGSRARARLQRIRSHQATASPLTPPATLQRTHRSESPWHSSSLRSRRKDDGTLRFQPGRRR